MIAIQTDRPGRFALPIKKAESSLWGRKPIRGEPRSVNMERDIEKKAEQALVAITLSTATLIVCVAMLVLR